MMSLHITTTSLGYFMFVLLELFPANQDMSLNSITELDVLGEGGQNGDINQGQGFVFSVLEVCLCLIVRHIPTLNPVSVTPSTVQVKQRLANNEFSDLISSSVTALEALPDLCSPAGKFLLDFLRCP